MSLIGCCRKFPKDKELVDDGVFHAFPHRIGGSTLLYGKKNSHFPYQIFVGPDWPCMVATYALIIVPSIFFLNNIASQWGPAIIIPCALLVFATLSAFSFTACSDPGIIFTTSPEREESKSTDLELGSGSRDSGGSSNSPNASLATGKIECGLCHIQRPKTASHCYDCGVCVDGLDHHCPWTGKCIGKKTIYGFYTFLWTLMALIFFVVIMVIVTAVRGDPIFNLNP